MSARAAAALDAGALRDIVFKNTERIAASGQWPAWIDRTAALAARVPAGGVRAAGFDAGIACALGLMPCAAETLSATLHAAYTPAAITAVRGATEEAAVRGALEGDAVRGAIEKDGARGLRIKDAESAACWWLAACSLCAEGDVVDEDTFRAQIAAFAALQENPAARRAAAEDTLDRMCRSFDTARGYAFGDKDGCMQGAYIAGHDVAVMHAAHHGVYFIGTFHASLGLEHFNWSTAVDEKGRAKSGPVHGSRQFVKCADESELARAIKAVRLPGPAGQSARPSP
jgi:hypothetical protein